MLRFGGAQGEPFVNDPSPLDLLVAEIPEAVLPQLVAGRLDAVDVRDRRRERELVAVDPLLLPVEHREVGGARRLRVGADPFPSGVGHRHQRDTGRPGEALLRAGDADDGWS